MSRRYFWPENFQGTPKHPPCNYSFNKDEAYHNDVNEGFQLLIGQETSEHHGSPYWASDVHREITHSGESPLFTNKLLATGKFEQEHGVISFERALLHTKTRRSSAPRRRTQNGKKEFYRPNSTHQYLSATDLKHLTENEEMIGKYGRPTRTTLLRARQRSNSAPVNAYDVRRENNRRVEDVKTNSIFCTSKELFDREQTRISYRFYNIYASDGETMHSFLTGARYNRAHLLDSKGLSVYGVYMPRENPTDCFMTGHRRLRDVGDDVPSAPPDSPRSDLDETQTPRTASRPTSSRYSTSRPSSSQPSSRPTTRQTSSRPQSYKKSTPRTPLSRPRSAKEMYSPSGSTRFLPPKSGDSSKREPLPEEVTMAMPDHINKSGKSGVYVTLKGQKMIETLESNLPRVTGVSLPKLRKSRDAVDEMLVVNQPPPTPVDVSVGSVDKTRLETYNAEDNRVLQTAEDKLTEVENENEEQEPVNIKDTISAEVEQPVVIDELVVSTAETTPSTVAEAKDTTISKVYVSESDLSERKTLEIGPANRELNAVKRVNFRDSDKAAKQNVNPAREADVKSNDEVPIAVIKVTDNVDDINEAAISQVTEENKANHNDNVTFFVTEEHNDDNEATEQNELNETSVSEDKTNSDKQAMTKQDDEGNDSDVAASAKEDNDIAGSLESSDIGGVIKVNISEGEKKTESEDKGEETRSPVTSENFPFTQEPTE